MDDDLIGKQIGNYRLIEEIASGSFGTVYRAQHIYLSSRIVALKLLHMHMPVSERERFIQEAQFLENLQYRYILSVVDMGFDSARAYIASTYAPGGSLRELLNKTRLLPPGQVLTILTQVGKALHYAHQQNIVHCDLKPDNILFNAQGEALLADFGIATVLSTMRSIKQLTSGTEGTPPYMAPEQFRGQVSKETDQYALGCIAYELVTGRRPFSAPDFISIGYLHATEPPIPPHQLNTQIPVHVEQAILKALAKQRGDRHKDVAAFVSALQTPPVPQITKEEWLNRGHDLYNLKRYQEALEAYEQALRLDPNYVIAHHSKGNALCYLKRSQEALLTFEQVLRLDPTYAYAYYGKGSALYDLNRPQEALLAFEQALRLDPNLAPAYYGKGIALYDLNRPQEALLAFEQALRLDPNLVPAYNNMGNTLDRLGRSAEAQQARKKARELGWT